MIWRLWRENFYWNKRINRISVTFYEDSNKKEHVDNGFCDIEQYMEDEMAYQAQILPDQDTYISVFTKDEILKVGAEYKLEPVAG